jgi:fructose-bisphosphate aldolase class I
MIGVEDIKKIAKLLVVSGKGIFAADASVKSITTRLADYGVGASEEERRRYRQLLFTTPGLGEFISGVIMHDESLRQADSENKYFRDILSGEGILVGIKVDRGTVDMVNFPGEKVAEGLDGLRERLAEYVHLGAKFTKWRAVITIGEKTPTREALKVNAEILARYAALTQEAGMVPIVEPEVIMEGNHTAGKCAEATTLTGKAVFEALTELKVDLGGMIYKVNMVLPGKESGFEISDEEVADRTTETLNKVVSVNVAGVVFLSGGQDPMTATRRLNAIVKHDKTAWPMTFSFERALEQAAMEKWFGKDENAKAAQEALLHRAKMNSLAVRGLYVGENV